MTSDYDDRQRQPIHKRNIECVGYLRADGLWDIEGRLNDSKTHSVQLSEGRLLTAGQAFHSMWIRLTLDDDFIVRDVQVSMSEVPTSECRSVAPAYQKLLGERVGPGFSRRIKELFGGIGGCVHLTELLLPIATTAFQTIPIARALVAPRNEHDTEAHSRALSGMIDTCYALRSTGPIASAIKK
ncbi:DUF2889 domain-containing protein [Pseudomonas japonica]|uniref:DUF2889 domain-containing protein n=1 Tax=Pseudomonas japonica TaxID=256466 RepID=A0A239A9B6_9PSED|nr:DUF2889 domain-containing protein [Pseudomonas japonica]SNR92099.1 Protein of unknown function [Pseudomonas japonica]